MPNWLDIQIHLSDVFLVGGGIFAFIRTTNAYRDLVRDLGKDVEQMKKDWTTYKLVQDKHHEWLIRSGMDRRVLPRRDNESNADMG